MEWLQSVIPIIDLVAEVLLKVLGLISVLLIFIGIIALFISLIRSGND